MVNRNAVIQTGATVTRQTGFLSDPYKLVLVEQSILSDQRPDERTMFSWTTRLRQYLQRSRAALQLDYRYFLDSWDIQAHTLDAAWVQPLNEGWELTSGVRYYTQKAPDFYAPYFEATPSDPYWSSDYRLATYGALSYRLNLQWQQHRYQALAGVEYYDSDSSLALAGKPQDTPGLVDFWRLSVAFTVSL